MTTIAWDGKILAADSRISYGTCAQYILMSMQQINGEPIIYIEQVIVYGQGAQALRRFNSPTSKTHPASIDHYRALGCR